MDRASNSWRNKRNLNHLNLNGPMTFTRMHYTIAPYYTNVPKMDKFPDLLTLPRVPDMTKNLADTLVTEKNTKTTHEKQKETPSDSHGESYLSLMGNLFSGIMNIVTVFTRRAKSPVRYYDCVDLYSHEGSPALESWQPSKIEEQNKNERPEQLSAAIEAANAIDMASDCRAAAAHCEDKLNKVRLLLLSKPAQNLPKSRPKRMRKRFIEPGGIEENFVDAFTPEDFNRKANVPYVQCVSVGSHQKQELIETYSPKTKTETSVHEVMDIVKMLPEPEKHTENQTDMHNLDTLKTDSVSELEKTVEMRSVISESQREDGNAIITTTVPDNSDLTTDVTPKQVISSCEDKMSRLKALLQGKCKNRKNCSSDSLVEPVKDNERPKVPTKSVPIEETVDKRFKNPHRSLNKRCKAQMRKNIQEDMVFAQEIDSDISSFENSPSICKNLHERVPNASSMDDLTDHNDFFDEVTGKFKSMSSDSDNSFQIVFSDSPTIARSRKASDCDSEDSYIIFEDTPDNCYTNHDIFGDNSDSGTESDNESDLESDVSDSGRGTETKLSHSLSRTISDLTDDSLYEEVRPCDSEDEVDCAFKNVCEELPNKDRDINECVNDVKDTEVKSTGLLIDEAKKLQRKNLPTKKVTFSSKPPKVHVMRVWAFAARQARIGNWERYLADMNRFRRRIADVDMAISWVLKPQHRSRIMFQRFMPWWNAQKRKELAEKKQRDDEERLRCEAERKDLESRPDGQETEKDTVLKEKSDMERTSQQQQTATTDECQVIASSKEKTNLNSEDAVPEGRRPQSESRGSRVIAVKN